MFWGAESFNGDVSGWDTSSVWDMNYMFRNATKFDQTLCWDLSNIDSVDYVNEMFCGSQGSFDPTCVPPDYYEESLCKESLHSAGLTRGGLYDGQLNFPIVLCLTIALMTFL